MGILQFKRVTRDVESLPFDCGVNSINEYVKDSYFPMITQHAYAYSIMHGDILLGYYQVMFREIELEDFPEEISDFDPCIKEGTISAVHIRYIAIDTKYQRHKIGTATLQTILKDIEELAGVWPIRVVTIDARVDLVEWYEREGFVKMKKNTEGQDGITQAMYFNCMRYANELQEYMEYMTV